jgi:exonuclease SbcD
MKFIHTSDWHIGRQFHNVSLLEDQAHVLAQIIDYIKSEEVDALIISGDIYDRSVPPASAVDLLDKTLSHICLDLNVPVILISGNHDSDVRVRFGAKHMKDSGLHILGNLNDVTTPVILGTGNEKVAFYGIPYCEPLQVKDTFQQDVATYDQAHTFLVEQIKKGMSDNCTNVLLSHCFIDGASECESERPLQIGGADRVSFQPCEAFDYVALGHLHSPQYKGAEHIRYSGSIMKYSFSEEKQKKGVTLVEVNSAGQVQHQHLALTPLRDMRVIESDFESIIQQGKSDPNNQDYLLVRLNDKHAILDPMGKLREVYPNVLHLERPGLNPVGDVQLKRDALKKNELDMFKDFYSQIQGEQLSDEQNTIVKQLIDEILV